MKSRFIALALLAATVLTSGGTAHAILKAVGAVNSFTGFPIFYQAQPVVGVPTFANFPTGLKLELCVDWIPGAIDPLTGLPTNQVPCLFNTTDGAPGIIFPIVGNPGNWPDESFWYMAAADFTGTALDGALVEFAIEAAYGGGPTQRGDEIAFTRFRTRIDGLTPNAAYTFVTPFNNPTGEVVLADGTGRINTTIDIGIGAPGDFTGALNGRVTPSFLTWPNFETDPALVALTNQYQVANGLTVTPTSWYIGDGGTPHTVVGGLNGVNTLTINGPNIGGPGINTISTANWVIMGKVSQINGVQATAAHYAINIDGAPTLLDLFAATPPDAVPVAVVRPTNLGVGAANLTAGTGPNVGEHFAHGDLGVGGVPPATVIFENVSDPTAPYPARLTSTVAVTDRVNITKAYYDPATTVLTVSAFSSDKRVALGPSLTVYDQKGPTDAAGAPLPSIGLMTGGNFASIQATPPSKVIVVSSQGGRAEAQVETLPQPPVNPPVRRGAVSFLGGAGS